MDDITLTPGEVIGSIIAGFALLYFLRWVFIFAYALTGGSPV